MPTTDSGVPPSSPYDPSGNEPPQQQFAAPYGTGHVPPSGAVQPSLPFQPPAPPSQQSPPQYPGATPYPYGAGHPAQYEGQPFPKNSLGVWSLVLGIMSLVLLVAAPFLSVLVAIPAIIVGTRGRRAVRNGEADNDGLALGGVITGWIGAVFGVAVVLFFVIALVLAAASASL